MTVYAALPFIATGIAFFALRERLTIHFILCGLVASLGIVTMSSADVARDDILGICAAFVMTAGFAAALVQAKKYPFLDMTLITIASAVASGLIAPPLMQIALPEPQQLLACALLGGRVPVAAGCRAGAVVRLVGLQRDGRHVHADRWGNRDVIGGMAPIAGPSSCRAG